jgi:hypothetical protein
MGEILIVPYMPGGLCKISRRKLLRSIAPFQIWQAGDNEMIDVHGVVSIDDLQTI